MDLSPRSHPADEHPAAAATGAARHDRYVSQVTHLASPGRADLIDVVADEFERRLDAPSTAPALESRRAA